ncbi:serine hydrolase domain-containing protein [Geothrix paludis]|uniref:serine hydrolase domain-containing protein n=1 Tax=Geothrix paludis TaxID=2922722 RepID=UPI001FAB41D3|nr:serine hydrolase [Geothrix paludis]
MTPSRGFGAIHVAGRCPSWFLGWVLLLLHALAHAQAASPVAPLETPALAGDGWQRLSPAEAGFDPARLHALLLEMMDGRANLHGVVVERHGRLVAEAYRTGRDRTVNSLFAHTRAFGPEVRHDARSVGKSVIGLLVGVALAQGRLKRVDTPVLEFYPEFPELASPERRAITLEHLLGMSSGLAWHEGGDGPDDEHKLMWKWTPVYHPLSRPVAVAPGTVFNYNSGGALLLADILARATGMPWTEYARTALFEPLGIRDVEWVGDFLGRPMAYTGLRMRPRDMAKLGRLVLNRGQWQGRQIVPSAWIDASLTPRLRTGFDDTGYGYLWWTGSAAWHDRAVPWAAAFGNGGQRIFVAPDLDLCVVITAGAYGDLKVARQVNAFFREIVATVGR